MLQVIHLGHSRIAGGAEIALKRLVESASTWSPTLVLPRKIDKAPDAFAGLGIPVVGRGPSQDAGASKAGPLSVFKFAVSVVCQAISVRFSRWFTRSDVVHANTTRACVYGALACWFSRKPFVVHLRDMVTKESLGPIGYWLFRFLVIPRANGIIANSESTLSSATPIPTGVLAGVIPSPAGIRGERKLRTHRAGVKRVGMVARLDPWKGQRLLIAAFARADLPPEVKLILAGAPAFGHEGYELELRVFVQELGLEGRVQFLGHVEEISKLIDTLDICVQASLRPEPLGQNVLQYLAAQCPTIVADEGGPTEWVQNGRNGLHFRARDVDSLAAAIERLAVDDKLRMELSNGTLEARAIPTDAEIADLHGMFFAQVFERSSQGIRGVSKTSCRENESTAPGLD